MSASRVDAPLLLSAGDPATVADAATALRSGMVVAIPTDTVYGLAAALDRPDAIARLYRLKNRPHEKAIPVLLADVAALDQVAANVPRQAWLLMERYWPGALTVVIPARPGLPQEVTSVAADGTRTVAVRIPDHPVARALLAAAGGALAVTSANHSGEPPALDAQAVMRLGDAAPNLVVDAGPAPLREPSTVVLTANGETSVLREGAIPAAAIAETVRHAARGLRDAGPNAPHAV
jgi:L-threonylcarbamoyladenylate synthase